MQQKVGDYFESCMDTGAIDAAGLGPAQPFLDKLASLNSRQDLIAALAPLERDTPGSYFFPHGHGPGCGELLPCDRGATLGRSRFAGP